LSVKAFVVPPLSPQQVPGQGLARRTHAAHPQPPPPGRWWSGAEHGPLRSAASAAGPWGSPQRIPAI